MSSIRLSVVCIGCVGTLALTALPGSAVAQNAAPSPGASAATPPAVAGIQVPADYVIGPDDVLTIVFWREKDLSGDVVVRPDGRISLPLVNDIEAGGLTPEQLGARVTEAAEKFLEEPTVMVGVKQINSRKVFITGNIARPNSYPLSGPMRVTQLIAMAGGLLEYAKAKQITILRVENGQQQSIRFNYEDVSKGKNLAQNIELRPGDTVFIP